jgi:hypothetical protein
MWCVPELDAEFIERMEDLLNLYERPHNPKEPVVCLDERPTPLRADARPVLTRRDASRLRDSEYVRHGVANVFGVVEPKAGRHFTRATPDRKNPAVAVTLRDVTRAYPDADTIHLVMDNASTHTRKALTDRFGLVEGQRIWERFSVHYTPKHGSWLNQAEIELSIYVRQCLGSRRIPSYLVLRSETAAWNRRANRNRITIDWKFTARDARRKFKYRRLRTSRSED